MTSAELMKLLEDDGWHISSRKGSHITYKKEGYRYHITIKHPTKDVSRGLLRDCLKKMNQLQ